MFRCVVFAVGLGLLLTAAAVAQQLPPGYQGVIQVTNDPCKNRQLSMNNRGQFVFAKWLDPFDSHTSEIYLYDNGVLTRLTEDYIRDDMPTMNDAAEIAWSRGIGPGGTLEIVVYRDGDLTRLTEDAADDSSPWINNSGVIAWNKFTGQGCAQADADIYVYDGETIQRITFGGYSNQDPCLNDLGDIVWTRYNFCHWPWTSEIMMYSDGLITALTGDQAQPQLACINNNRLVAWQHDEPGWNKHIRVWQDGITTVLTDWGGGLRLNNRGDVVFNRWHDDSSTWQVWLYYREEFWQITDDPYWNRSGDIDDHGNIAWESGPTPDRDIMLLERFPAGDLNCDAVVDAFDIDPFVLALTDPSAYELTYPDCDYLLADINTDGAVDAFDIDPFVLLLTGP